MTVLPLNTRPVSLKLNRRQKARQATRQKLIATARRLFMDVGFFDTSIRDVAAAMGMSTGAVFAHVATKDELWRLAFDGPPPSTFLAQEVALIEALLPEFSWLHRKERTVCGRVYYVAVITSPDYNPAITGRAQHITARGDSPAGALRGAREAVARAGHRGRLQ